MFNWKDLSENEFNVILAALRLYGTRLEGRNDDVADVEIIATNSGASKAPTADMVHALADRMLESNPYADSSADPDVLGGLWLVSDTGNLYILPLNGDEVIGPDDQTADSLMRLWQDLDTPHDIPEEKYEALGLTRVADTLKRWNPVDGYYHA